MKIIVKYFIGADYKPAGVWRVEIISEVVESKGAWEFMTSHISEQPIGEAIEQHEKALKNKKEARAI